MSTELVFAALEQAQHAAVSDEAGLIAARDRWHTLAGKIHDDEPLYEERAGAFLEWYALEYKASVGAPSVVERLIGEHAALSGAEAPITRALRSLAANHRSLFRVREVQGHTLLLDDLWGGGVFRVKERRQLAGVGKGELIDARIVADIEAPPDLLLTRILCVHPREAEPAIRAAIERAQATNGTGKDRPELLFYLLRLRVRCERYIHVAPVRIYTAGESFKERDR